MNICRGPHSASIALLRIPTALLLAGSSIAFAPPALAQVDPSTVATLENVVVTARRREESAQSVGAALSVFSTDQLARIGADNALSLASSVPNMTIGVEKSDLKVMIRGVGSDNIQAYSDPGVAFHIDGVYQARPTGGNAIFYDLARVEVLRGPQGTLYGRNATGGAVNLISRLPSYEWEVLADATVGDYDQRQIRAVVNAPIARELLALRLTGTLDKRDGYEDNRFPGGTDGADADDRTARAQLLFTPSDDLQLVLRASSQDRDGAGQGRKRVASAPGNCQDCNYVPTIRDLRTTYKDTPESIDSGTRAFSANLDWDVGFGTLTVLGARQYNHLDANSDVDQMLIPFGQPGGNTSVATLLQRSEQKSVEARLASNSSGAFEWLIGGFYLREKPRQHTTIYRRPTTGASLLLNNAQDVRTQSVAEFGQVAYKFTDALKATVGVRYSQDEKHGVGGSLITIDPPGPAPATTTGSLSSVSDGDWNEFTWKAGLEWQIAPDHLLYSSVSTGYKAGGFNIGNPQAGNYDPEKITAYEIGSKSLLREGTAQLNTSAFYYDYTDLQVYQVVNQTTLTTNASSAEVYGLELEVQIQLLAGLRIDGNVGYLHARYKDFLQSSNLFLDTAPGTPLPSSWDSLGLPPHTRPGVAGRPITFDLSGNSLVNAPDWSAQLGVQYGFALGEGTLTARAQAGYQSRIYFRTLNLFPYDSQASATKVDLRLVYEHHPWSLELFANNVTDRTTVSNIEVTDSGVYLANLTPPRQVGVRLGVQF